MAPTTSTNSKQNTSNEGLSRQQQEIELLLQQLQQQEIERLLQQRLQLQQQEIERLLQQRLQLQQQEIERLQQEARATSEDQESPNTFQP